MTLSRTLRLTAGLCAFGLAVPTALQGEQLPATQPHVAESAAPAPSAVEERHLWTDASGVPSRAALALLDALAAAPTHALPDGRYGVGALSLTAMDLQGGGAGADEVDAFERAMTRAFTAWGSDMVSGVVEPSKVDKEIKVKPLHRSDGELLDGLAAASDPAAWLAALAPADEDYARLRDAYAGMQELVRSGGWGAPVPEGPTLRLGDSGKRVEALRKRLTAMGDMPRGDAGQDGAVIAVNEVTNDAGQQVALSDPWRYDERLAQAVKRFQYRHGLNTDGVVGPATLGALNTSAETRLGQIAANLERLRWLNRDLGDRHVMVNIAGFTMALVENGKDTFTSRVVVGQKENQTPEFSDVMEHMVVNPSWNVPYSIASKEILPKLRRDRYYLDRNNMHLVNGPDPWFVDWSRVSASNFPWRIKQRPGSGNALGRVKFLFPNDNAIYLHDTPSRSLFAKDMRAFSHGCIRVEKPIEFAHILLTGQVSDPAATFEGLRSSGRERWVQLDEHLPVHIGYRTAWIDDDGLPQFRADIYGRDELLVAALDRAGVSLSLN